MLKRNDLVEYSQLEMFDKALVGRRGLFQESFIKPFGEDGEEVFASVLFFQIGFRDVPISCLTKIKC